MKKKSLPYMVILAGLLLLVLWDCRKKAEEEATYPTVSFDEVSQITSFSTIARGNVSSDGGAAVTDKGFCWGTNLNPTISNNKISIGTGTGSFSSSISGLISGTTYYIGAYATNAKGIAYSNQVSFITVAFATVVTTIDLNSITSTTATVGGTITSVDGSPITGRGVCWNTTWNPTIADSKTTEGPGAGTFTSNLAGFTPGKTYYVKAYATNSNGIIYGNKVTFNTKGDVPVITTSAAYAITPTTANCTGDIVTNGGSAITVRGVCWSTSPNPTIADNKTTDTVKDYIFGILTGLLPTTTYYVRAYATNSAGTAYGNQVTFTTTAFIPLVTTKTVTGIASSTATSGGDVTSDNGSVVTARGVCWDTSRNPTIANSKTDDGTGSGSFTSHITGLSENTTYYYRAYATNSNGTGYGTGYSFKTFYTNNDIIFNPELSYGTVADIDGNVYKTIRIGTQTWMAENLKTTRYRNGDPITNVIASAAWQTLQSGAYCWYNNDAATYKENFGALYNWYAVADVRIIAPTGWHVPTDAEWTTLSTYLGGESYAGGTMKEVGITHWKNPNTGATNSSGFTALPGGMLAYSNSYTTGIQYGGLWWTSTPYDASYAWYFGLNYDFARFPDDLICRYQNGLSVRCVQD
jgi:uncharacterized protein (TIGR02145 family)